MKKSVFKFIYLIIIATFIFHITPQIANAYASDEYEYPIEPKNMTLYTNWTNVCDINKDGFVNIFDVVFVARDYGLTNNDAGWVPAYDIKEDGAINLFDLIAIARQFKDETAAYINSISDLSVSVVQGTSYNLPYKVTAAMSDGSIKDVVITWNSPLVDTSKSGGCTYEGSVEGYNKKVILNLTIIEAGNSTGNLINGGMVCRKGEWIYYVNPLEASIIYKIKADGTSKTRLNSDVSKSINVVGDWIYYDNLGSIFKIKTDGTNRTLIQGKPLFYSIKNLTVSGDWIYYVEYNSWASSLRRMKTDGTEGTYISIASTDNVSIQGEWIYYSEPYGYYGSGGLCKIKNDGTDHVKLAVDINASWINVSDGWIYFIGNSNEDYSSIYKIREDGTDKTKINNDAAAYLNVAGDWIYYSNMSDGNKLYKVRTDGTERIKINEDNSQEVNAAGDLVIYKNMNSSGKYYSINADGSERKQFCLEIVRIANISASVNHFSEYSLPKTVSAYMNNNSYSEVPITWESSTADTDTVGVYEFIGNVYGYSNAVKLTLEVKPAIENIDDMVHEVKQYESYSLPKTVTAKMSDGTLSEVWVWWNASSVSTSKPGIYELEGSVLDYPDKVRLKVIVKTYIVEGLYLSEEVYQNNSFILPKTITVWMNNGERRDVFVAWDSTNVDTAQPGTYTYEGSIEGYNDKVTLVLSVISIKEIANINIVINEGEKFTRPAEVTATVNDGTARKVPVTWDKEMVDTLKTGLYLFEGKVENYEGNVELSLKIRNIGNTFSNLINSGLFAKEEDWVYYSNPLDSDKLYKMKNDNSVGYKLSDDVPRFINVVNGWVYYITYNPIPDNYSVYKIRNDGTDKTMVAGASNFSGLYVVDDWLYYLNSDDSSKLYRVKVDGTSSSKVIDEAAYPNVVGDWIYYVSGGDMYKTSLDGASKMKIASGTILDYVISGDWIYYYRGASYNDLRKVKLDGTQETRIAYALQIGSISVKDDWIYYTNSSDNARIYRMKIDGSVKEKFSDDEGVPNINIIDDWIYYSSGGPYNHNYYKMKIDKTNKMLFGDDRPIVKANPISESINKGDYYSLPLKVTVIMSDSLTKLVNVKWDNIIVDTDTEGVFNYQGSIEGFDGKVILTLTIYPPRGNTIGNMALGGKFAYANNLIYYSNASDNNKLYRMRTDGTEKVKINDDPAQFINIIGEWIYYSSEQGLFKVKDDGTDLTKLKDGINDYINVVGKYIYYSSGGKLYRMSIDNYEAVEEAGYLSPSVMSGDWSYRVEEVINRGMVHYTLFKININNWEEKISLCNASGSGFLSLESGWVYLEDGYGFLCRIRTDGTQFQKYDIKGYDINVSGEWIYYEDIYTGKLSKCNTDGTAKTILDNDEESVAHIYVLGDWIYYLGGTESKWYRIRTDGTCKSLVD